MPADGSPTSFGETLAGIFAPPASVHANAADALRLLAASDHVSPGFKLALDREIAALDHHAREAARYDGVAPSGLGPGYREPRPIEQLVTEGDEIEAKRQAYLASPVGKARKIIAKACGVCAEVKSHEAHAGFQAVADALSRGDGSAVRLCDELQERLFALGFAELQIMATELRVCVGEAG
jgi:hypothetical protein